MTPFFLARGGSFSYGLPLDECYELNMKVRKGNTATRWYSLPTTGLGWEGI
jgi:hypothetical protein